MSFGKEEGKSSQSIFRTLFGEIREEDVPTSIFSQSNPFRVNTFDTLATHHVAEKRKKGKKSRSRVGSDSDEDVDVRKCKKHRKSAGSKLKLGFAGSEDSIKKSIEGSDCISNLDAKLIEAKGCAPDRSFVVEESERMETDSGGRYKQDDSMANCDNIRKKRKRREIEEEYEEKIYGAPKQDDAANQGPSAAVGGKKRKNVDSSSEVVAAKEEIDDESKFMRTIFVGNLALSVKKKAILKEFSQFGEIESLRLRSIPLDDSKLPRMVAVMKKKINYSAGSAHAYIVFKEEQSAQNSLSLNMCVFGGNHIRVDRGCPPKKKLKGYNTPIYDIKRTVFVGNLPFDITDEEVYQLFINIKNFEIEAIRVIRDPRMRICKGIAYVLMKTREGANMVVKKRLKLHDRELRLSLARDDFKSSKNRKLRSAPSSATASAAPSSSSGDKKGKGRMPYEGIRSYKEAASLRVAQKKARNGRLQEKPDPPKTAPVAAATHGKIRLKGKRPAVAERKAKALGLKVPGKKRKREGHTPGSGNSSSRRKVMKKTRT